MKRPLLVSLALLGSSAIFGQNLAGGKTTYASSGVETSSLAVDGNMGTRWESAHSDSEWIAVDLGQREDIGKVLLHWEGAYGKQYEIQVSDDNENWNTVYIETNSDGNADDLSVEASGRYVRMLGKERATEWGYSLWELQVFAQVKASVDATLSDIKVNGVSVPNFLAGQSEYNVELPIGSTAIPIVEAVATQSVAKVEIVNATELPGTTTVTVTSGDGTVTKVYNVHFTVDKLNVALNKTASASSSAMPAQDAFDGNTATRWASANQDGEWLQVDLGGVYTINGFQLNWEGACAKIYDLQVSRDGDNWTKVYSNENGLPGVINITPDTEETGRYVRLNAIERSLPYGSSVWEFEVYGEESQESIAKLSDIKVGGVSIEGFDPSKTSYKVMVDKDAEELPVVTVETYNDDIKAVIIQATSVPGTATIEVTAKDGQTKMTYSVEFFGSLGASPVPTHPAENVVAIYCDAYETIQPNLNPNWGQSTIVTEEIIDGDNLLKYSNLSYQGTEFGAVDVSMAEYLHFDYWTTDCSNLNFYIVNQEPKEAGYVVTPVEQGRWVSVDIPLSYYVDNGVGLANVFQLKVTGNNSVYLDNIYFWGTESTSIEESQMESVNIYIEESGVLVVNADSEIENIKIYSGVGQQVYNIEPNTTATTIDLSHLQSGVYIARVKTEGVVTTNKLIKK